MSVLWAVLEVAGLVGALVFGEAYRRARARARRDEWCSTFDDR